MKQTHDVSDRSCTSPMMHELWSPNQIKDDSPFELGAALLEKAIVSREQIDSARRLMVQTPGATLHDILLDMGAEEAPLMKTLAEGLGLDHITPDLSEVDHLAIAKLGLEYCKARRILPISGPSGRITVGTASAVDIDTLDEVRAELGGGAMRQVLVGPGAIERLLEDAQPDVAEEFDLNEILADAAEADVEIVEENDEDEIDDGSASPVVRYVNHIIQSAVREGASDIHVEPSERSIKIRFRIDGVLYEMMNPPRRMLASLTSRIKIMASLDIAERRLPQDGRIRVQVHGRPLDLRVSTAPTPHGEKTVMRLLDNRSIQVTLDELGFADSTLTHWRSEIAKPHGILLVTGPTGSGKTTTLYSSIQELDLQKLNVSTVEDPVEYQLRNITQIQTHDRIGLTFASSLRTLLRQDPDVIMIGEIRDHETATISIQAALTGHLVLSTLHTNDAPSSITRLINIGIEPFLVAGAVNAVLAQRLMRRVCRSCEHSVPVSSDAAAILKPWNIDLEQMVMGSGCDACRQTGYAGRLGVHEMLTVDDPMRDQIASNPTVNELRTHCCSAGMRTLREDAIDKMAAGETTLEEVLRVTPDA